MKKDILRICLAHLPNTNQQKNERMIAMKTPFKCMWIASLLLVSLVITHPAYSLPPEIGESMTITGTVYDCEAPGSGIQIDTGDEIVTVYGKGPAWYWEQQDVDFPDVGESITVYAYEIMFSDGMSKLVAWSMSMDTGDDVTVQIVLRDEDGRPLWRQHGENIVQHQAQAGTQTAARNGARWAE